MDILLTNEAFRLIYVNNGSMTLINASDPNRVEDVRRNGYRCISHVWGTQPIPIWNDHGVTNAKTLEMHRHKRDKLLKILNYYGGYWWVDVFCNQSTSSKPLSVMGEIYKNCTLCVAMWDYYEPNIYMLEEKVMCGSADGDTIRTYISLLEKCRWFRRVWTFQEFMLPPNVCHTSDGYTGTMRLIYPADLLRIRKMCPYPAEHGGRTPLMPHENHTSIYMMKGQPGHGDISLERMLNALLYSSRESTNNVDYYYGIAGVTGALLRPNLSLRKVEKEFFAYCKTRGIYLKKVSSSRTGFYGGLEMRNVYGYKINARIEGYAD